MARSRVSASEWVARRTGLLVVHVRRDSPDAENVAEIAQRCADLLMLATGAVGVDEAELPTIRLFLGECPEDPQANELAGTAAQNDVERNESRTTQVSDDLVIWASALDEAAIELTRALLARVHGGQPGVPLFWDEGLAAFVAARSRHDAHGGDAPDPCRKLLRDRAMPPIAELVAGSATHLSGLATLVADVFVAYLIERFGLQRYQELVAATHTAGADRFDEVYPVSLVIAERDWRRQLEAADDQYRASSSCWTTGAWWSRARTPSCWVAVGCTRASSAIRPRRRASPSGCKPGPVSALLTQHIPSACQIPR